MTPDRPMLASVRALLDGLDDPAEAFERLTTAGALPPSWTGDKTRAFWWWTGDYPTDGLDPLTLYHSGGMLDTPRTLADLVAWASLGVPAIVRAEDLTREAVARLAPWGVARGPRRVVWRVGAPSARATIGWPYRDVDRTVGVERFVAGHKHTLREGDPHATTAALVRVWPDDAPPCPYAPLLDLLRAGVTLDAITDRDLVLVVPPVTPAADGA